MSLIFIAILLVSALWYESVVFDDPFAQPAEYMPDMLRW
jgi:hypothetical protein